MELREVHSKTDLSEEMKRLYNASFPDDERIPWRILTRGLSNQKRLFTFYDNDELIGIAYVFTWKIHYLGYIAVEEEKRDQGYGTRMLEMLEEEYRHERMVVDIEIQDETAPNNMERKRRKAFYQKAGFAETGVFYHFFHVDYELLSYGGKISKDEFRSLVRKHWGPAAEMARYWGEEI